MRGQASSWFCSKPPVRVGRVHTPLAMAGVGVGGGAFGKGLFERVSARLSIWGRFSSSGKVSNVWVGAVIHNRYFSPLLIEQNHPHLS